MALSVDRQAREQYFGNPAVKNDDTTYGPWSAHATYLGVTWTSEPDPQVKAVAPIENWDYTHRQSNPLLNPRSSLAPSVTRDLSHSLQQGYISVNTDPGHYRDPEGSPSALSPPSNQFYALGQYGGSTPSLVSPSLSTPPTGKSALLTLTPDQEMQAGRRLLASPGDWDKLSLQSPVHSYVTESGATPDLAGLRLHTYEDSFQMARPISSFGESSVLLGSNPSSEGSQASTDLDPLDLDAHVLADLGEEAFSTGSINGVTEEKFNIHITPAENTGHNVPIKVNLDSTWDPMLSPLASLQGLPFNYSVEDVGSYHDHSTGVAIQSLHWDFSHFPPSPALPIPINQPLLNDSLPSPHVHTSSNSPQIPESPYLTCNGLATRFRSCEDDVNTSPRSVLEAVRTGQHREIVNPKGVSDRTLAAAEANRKREAKFRCSVCGNSQTSKQNLENHIMSRHLQLKRFLCPIEGCSAKYGHARGVNRHLDTKHPGHRQTSSKGKRGPPKRV